MLSCASSSRPDQVRVHARNHISGRLYLDVCVNGASANDVNVDEHGVGRTSLCPSVDHTVEIEVYEDNQHFKLAQLEVKIQRSGDGMATSIEAKLPE
jgi:hypothetical protein